MDFDDEKPSSAGKLISHIAFALAGIALMFCIISFFSPFWLHKRVGIEQYEGLLAICVNDKPCYWFAEDDFAWEASLQDWQKACQGLFGFGLLNMLFTFIVACFVHCCASKRSYGLLQVIGGLLLLSFALIGISLIIYGVKMNQMNGASGDGNTFRFAWAFFLGIVGLLVDLAAGLFYIIDASITSKTHRGYEQGAPMGYGMNRPM